MIALRHAAAQRASPEAGKERLAAATAAAAAREAGMTGRSGRRQIEDARERCRGREVVGAEGSARDLPRAIAVTSRRERSDRSVLTRPATPFRRIRRRHVGSCAH